MAAIPAQDAERLAESLGDEVSELLGEAQLPDDVKRMLQVGFAYMFQKDMDATPRETLIAGQTAARVGYLSRAVEFERFESAREADLEMMKMVQGWIDDPSFGGESVEECFIEAATRLAATQPLDPAVDDPGAALWLVPGVGGALRGALRDYLVVGVARPEPDGRLALPPETTWEEMKRCWMYGFFLRVFMEFLNEDRLS